MMKFMFSLLLLISLNNVLAEDVFQVADKSIVYVEAYDAKKEGSAGTAFVVAPEVVATNHHVIARSSKIYIATSNKSGIGKVYEVSEVVWDSPGADLALLKVPGLSLAPLPISEALLNKGAKIVVIGFPGAADQLASSNFKGLESTFAEGIVGRVINVPVIEGSPSVSMIQHSAAINHGNSGGPLLDMCGRVIGVNDQKSVSGPIFKASDGQWKVSQTDGIFWSIGISALVDGIKAANLKLNLASGDCKIGHTPDGSAEFGSATWLSAAGIFGALILAAGALFFSLRKREVIRETFTQFQRRKPSESVGVERPTASSKYSWVLQGEGSDGQKIQLVLNSDTFIGGKAVLGRDATSCALVINDPSVSRKHLALELANGQLRVSDLGSTNGTWIDRERLATHPVPLRFGQILTIGKVVLKVEGSSV